MKELLIAIALSALPLQDDPCACGGCAGVVHFEKTGTCDGCKKGIPSCSDRMCAGCARAKKACTHCGKALKNPALRIGFALETEKQPRPDLRYIVLKPEGGDRLGLYYDPKRFARIDSVRVLLHAAELKGALVVRECLSLGPAEKDLKLDFSVEARWRLGTLEGKSVELAESKHKLVVPAVIGATIEVVAGDKVLSTHRFDGNDWTKK